MTMNAPPHTHLLLAIPDEWQNILRAFLEAKGFTVLHAESQEEAWQIIQSQSLCGLITVSEWGMTRDSSTTGLIKLIKGQLPSITLIRQTETNRCFDEVYAPPLHQYCTIPFGLEELYSAMQRATIVSDQQPDNLT